MLGIINSVYFTNEIIKSVCKEIKSVFLFLLKKNSSDDDSKSGLYLNKMQKVSISKKYNRLFRLIYDLFISVNKNCYNDINKMELINEVLSLLISITKTISEEFENDQKNEEILYLCLLQYIKLINEITFSDAFKNMLLSINIFVLNLIDLVNLCQKELLLYTNFLLNLKINGIYYKKTIIEIILDIYLNILMNAKYLSSHNMIFNSIKSVSDAIKISNKEKHTIFYYIDYQIILLNKKKQNKITKDINNINNLLSKEKNQKYFFQMSFTTFSLLKISCYLIYHKNNIFNNDLGKFLESYIKKLIEEHQSLYDLNKDILSKKSENPYYNEIKIMIETNFISKKSKTKKNITEDDYKKFQEFINQKLSMFEKSIPEEITSGKCNMAKPKENNYKKSFHKSSFSEIIESENTDCTENDKNTNTSLYSSNDKSIRSVSILVTSPNMMIDKSYFKEKEKKDENPNINNGEFKVEINKNEEKEEINENDIDILKNINLDYIKTNNDDLENKKKKEVRQFNLLEDKNNIYFFEDIDNNYIKNVKKDIMNNIFSLYFLDTFYYNELFHTMKNYFLNKFDNVECKTKSLNYPSKFKNYNNGLEPAIFLKQHNNFFNSKFYPISHPYFSDYLKKHNISNSIKLTPKKLPDSLINSDINKGQLFCELIKIETSYFGRILCFNMRNQKMIVFQEQPFNFEEDDIYDNEDNHKYIFSLKFVTYLEERKNKVQNSEEKNQQNETKKRNDKTIIIFYSDIEEIVERRFLFMWQGVEIYLKNGKSYYFNFFSEDRKENIMNIFKNDEILKNLIHDKDFLSKNKMITKEWKNYHLSTYEYLLLVNKYSGRTYNDNSQYPVFPWLLMKNYDKMEEINNMDDNLIERFFINRDNQNMEQTIVDLFQSLRKMKYPVCIQKKEKINDVIYKYTEDDGKFKYHLGIHYSTSSYIFYYLMRQEPYTDLLIELQNYQQENPNRMFIGIVESIDILAKCKDPREIIPQLFSNFEYLINLNCSFFGIKSNGIIVDDYLIDFFEDNKNPFFKYINFIYEHRKLLNSKIVSITINDWIDNIFGINQLPQKEKIRETCCNIYTKSTYEQTMNIRNKYKKYLQQIENAEDDQKIKTKQMCFIKLVSKINSILNFGQTPYQIFKKEHEKRKIRNNINEDEIEQKENEEDDYEFEAIAKDIIHSLNIECKMKNNNSYLYFEINNTANKIFILSKQRFLEIVNSKLYNKKEDNIYFLSSYDYIQLPFLLFNDKIITKYGFEYYIYKIKYSFSSFDEIEDKNYNNIDSKDLFRTYGRKIIEDNTKSNERENNNRRKETNDIRYYKFITCRYLDKSFKIHRFPKENDEKNINEDLYKTISFICEDIVCSCCTISFCQFLIGLKNGKLIQFRLVKKKEEQKKEEPKKEEQKKRKIKNLKKIVT